MNQIKIPFSEPSIGKLESDYINQALASGWIGGKGDFIDRFEAKFAKYIGVNHAITCSSGTAALLLSYIATGMKLDSKVIAPFNTFAATYNMARVLAQNVSMVKGDADTWNLNPKHTDTDYFIAVHLYGNPCDMGELYKTKYTFIEDCAQSLGSTFKGRKVGSFGKASAFSFHSAKTITTGEGGMVCTNDKEIAERVRHLKSHCMTKPYIHDNLGWNFRMTNIQAAMGVAQLERIDELLGMKAHIATRYNELLSDKFKRQEDTRNSKVFKWANAYSNPYASVIREKLSQAGIETRPGFNREDIIVLPSGVTLKPHEQDYVISQANEIANA